MAVYEYDSQNDELKRIAGGTLFSEMAIGTFVPFGGSSIPTGFLLCDGSAVSRTTYADLFAVIGTAFGSGDGSTTFNIPDMREATAKGAGLTSKSNNHLDADGLAVGEFIDDRIQNHKHGAFVQGTGGSKWKALTGGDSDAWGGMDNSVEGARTGDTTEVKSVGCNWIIKAQSVGVPADFVSAVTQVVDEQNSYSTTEVNTGKKWIDGKDIYKRVFICTTDLAFTADTWYDLCPCFNGLAGTVATIDTLVDVKTHITKNYVWNYQIVLKDQPSSGALGFWSGVQNVFRANDGFIIIEYTKTTA